MITLIIGPMFSGKTTRLVHEIDRARIARKRCVIVKYREDMRYNDVADPSQNIITHGKTVYSGVPIILTTTLGDIESSITANYDVIGVSETQFYADAAEKIAQWAAAGKIIVAEGLNGTWQQTVFPQIAALIPHAEHIIKLTAICQKCGSDSGNYSHLTTHSGDLVQIGGAEKYSARCRACFDAD